MSRGDRLVCSGANLSPTVLRERIRLLKAHAEINREERRAWRRRWLERVGALAFALALIWAALALVRGLS